MPRAARLAAGIGPFGGTLRAPRVWLGGVRVDRFNLGREHDLAPASCIPFRPGRNGLWLRPAPHGERQQDGAWLRAGPTVIPTLAARLRLKRLQDLAREHVHPPCQVEQEPPLALQSYLRSAETTESVEPAPALIEPPQPSIAVLDAAPAAIAPLGEPAPDAISTEQRSSGMQAPMPAWIGLLLWLVLLLVDGAIALRELLAQSRRQPRASRTNAGNANRAAVATWLGADLNPARLA